LYEDGYSVDSLINELEDMSSDDIIKCREYIKNNIETIKNILPDDKDFRKLDR